MGKSPKTKADQSKNGLAMLVTLIPVPDGSNDGTDGTGPTLAVGMVSPG